MSYIFRFHKGTNNNIVDWGASNKITAADTKDVMDKTNIVSSAAGTSIPTPVARMFLYRTAFEIVAAQVRNASPNEAVPDSLYARIVSESLDLLELLYKCGADKEKIRYQPWTFEVNDHSLSFFGRQPGHSFLSRAFIQAAAQAPFHNRISITLIYYKEAGKEVLLGGTSPFTFVFTSPNFKRKMEAKGFKPIGGLVSDDVLFDSQGLQLQERDLSFIKYVESLVNNPDSNSSFDSFNEYVINTRRRYEDRFDSPEPSLIPIPVEHNRLLVSQIPLMQINSDAYRDTIFRNSDFRMDLPEESFYRGHYSPLFLLDRMGYEGYQYTSQTSRWSQRTSVVRAIYPETTIAGIENRALPGLADFKYPFLSLFDFFEEFLIRLPGYTLNDERFVSLSDSQTFLLPLKPLFFHFFPIGRLKDFVSVEENDGEFTFAIKIPIVGATKGHWTMTAKKSYNAKNSIIYNGIAGIYPFARCFQPQFQYLNQYTVASYEKTVNAGTPINSVAFFQAGREEKLPTTPKIRASYNDINLKSTYYQLETAFDLMQLNFRSGYSMAGGVIIPRFKEVVNGNADYIYAIDFGTSNTHVEYGRTQLSGMQRTIGESKSFFIDQKSMQFFMLHKPKPIQENSIELDYVKSIGTPLILSRKAACREFMPFQILQADTKRNGAPGVAPDVRFPFRTATCESDDFFTNMTPDCSLFLDANIGFNIDDDAMADNMRYTTDLKWLLQHNIDDPRNNNRIAIFARQLMLMIRTKLLLEEGNQKGNVLTAKIALAFPISMSGTIKKRLTEIFDEQRLTVFGPDSQPLANPATESIAPYYQLRSKNINIQNDNFCNIDIGGGTTDIVITNTGNRTKESFNKLACYCCSFRFAGRQLWGSGSNQFAKTENGFVKYHLQLIAKNFQPLHEELHKAFEGVMRTEDLTGFLFSQPRYRFKDVFESNKEFRVVPLIHYAAILYYIAKLTNWKEIELPRTISFSGKGSEYLNMLFTSDDDLKMFTQIMLGKFANKETRRDFIIARTTEPKMITAKGTLHFAVENVLEDESAEWGAGLDLTGKQEKRLVRSNVTFNCFYDPGLEGGDITYGDLYEEKYLNQILASNQDFFDLLFADNQIVNMVNKKLEIRDFRGYKKFFFSDETEISETGELRDSLISTLGTFDSAENVTDAPFFFPLNYSLVKLSKFIAG